MKKKSLIGIIGAAVVVAAAVITTVIITTNNKTCKIGFYGLSDLVTQSLTDEITNYYTDKESDLELITIDNSKPLTEREAKKYNLIFTKKGKAVSDIENELQEFPKEIYNLMPSNIAASGKINDKNILMPVLLDHYEIAYYNTYREQCNLGIPQINDHLQIYLEKIKEKAIFPLYLAGADDEELLGFVSLLAQSQMAPDSYMKLVEDISFDMRFDNPLPPELKQVLKTTKEMVENQFLYRKWFETTRADLDFAMKEHKVGAIVTSLSNHREMPFIIIKYYDSFMYPKTVAESNGIIAPEICAVMPDSKNDAAKVVEYLVSTDTQAMLSDSTKLAPVSSRAMAHDVQADDVRFMAASTKGPLPSIVEGSCSTPDQVKALAAKVREYLSK